MTPIITLHQKDFDEACHQLAAKVLADDFRPDILIGIATGGDRVAAAMQQSIHAPHLLSIRLQRPSTKAKKHLLPAILPHLPRMATDALRRSESALHALRQRIHPPQVPEIQLPPDTLRMLADLTARSRILIADDAVDSGTTMLAVANAVTNANPQCQVRTAAITQTRKNPLISPRWLLMPIPTIVRFPWAPDL